MEITYPTSLGYYWMRRTTNTSWDFLVRVTGTSTPFFDIKIIYQINVNTPEPSRSAMIADDGNYTFVLIDEPVIA